MQAQLSLYLGILFYSVVVAILLVLFDTEILTSAIMLLGAPIAYWWHELYPSRLFIVLASIIAISTTILFETIAHLNGLWLSVSSSTFRLFGLFPVDVVLFNIVLYFYIIFFHEFLVDDKKMYKAVLDRKKKWLLSFVVGTTIGVLCFVLWLGSFVIPYAFSLLLLGLILAICTAAILSHGNPKQVLEKSLLTALLLLPIFVVIEIVGTLNVHTVFANPSQYLLTLTVFGELLPIEKVLYMIVAPVWIVSIYELFFDDAQ